MTPAELPSLNALRAFEAVARHRSFRRAAEELFVTPAAITHQIKLLESKLGTLLFNRQGRRVELTAAALAALPLMQQGFGALAMAVGQLRRQDDVQRLTVGASPTLASRWLMPRLQGFLSRYPGIDVRLVANGNSTRQSVECDIDIRFASDALPGDWVDLLLRIEILPMCHPRLVHGEHPLRTPDDLKHATLLHGDGRDPDRARSTWARWLHRAGVTGVDARRGLQFEHSTLALDAAADGLGVTLASPLLAAAELAAGQVVVVFPHALPLDNAYYLVTSERAMTRPEVSNFHAWLISEARLQQK